MMQKHSKHDSLKIHNTDFNISGKSTDFFKNFINYLPCCILTFLNDEFFTIRFANDNFFKLTGYSSSEMKELFNNHYIEIIHIDDHSKIKQALANQLNKSYPYEIEYRIIHKNGSIVWVKDNGNYLDNIEPSSFLSSITDITEEKLSDEKLKINELYYHTILEKCGDSMFVVNMEKNKMFFSDNFIEKFGKIVSNFKNIADILNSNLIHKDDKSKFKNITDNDLATKEYREIQIRIKNKLNEYIWCLIKFYILKDENNKVLKIIGILTDIDEAKKENENLHMMAQTDLLTTLYNKVTSQNLIENYISTEGKDYINALLIIDLDNFKQLNDSFGHLFGDSVLIEVSLAIKNIFEKDEIIGRIGGDEFIVFMKNITNKDIVLQKAKLLRNTLNRSYNGLTCEHHISGSIGIALYPDHGQTFKELFENADKAAYYCKEKGKNLFYLYNNSIKSINYINTRERFSKIDSESRQEDDFPKYIFEILYETKDIDIAINRILSLTAQYYNISHIFIYKYIDEINRLEKAYEYCKEGIVPAPNYSLVYDEFKNEDYKSLYDSNGIFCCNNTELLPNNIRELYKKYNMDSVLQSLIIEETDFKGVICFNHYNDRSWSQREIDRSLYVSKAISTFLLKRHRESQLLKLNNLFQFMLENTTTYNYIIDKQNYNLVYVNKRTTLLFSKAKVGEKCYRAIRGLDHICPDCPAINLNNKTKRVDVSIHDNKTNLHLNGIILLAKWIDDKDVYIVLQNIEPNKTKTVICK